MNHYVYITNPFLKPMLPLLAPEWSVDLSWSSSIDKGRIRALATTVWDNINADYLSQFPNLNLICHLGIGTDNIDTTFLEKHNITLLSQLNAGVHDTAELAFALMLNLARKIIPNDKYTRANHWVENRPRFLGNHLNGKQLGLVGLGKIGSKIARFAEAFGMNIAYTTRTKLNSPFCFYPNATSLATVSDFLIICCSGGTQTHHLISQTVLTHLGANGYLINVSRGTVVDQNALIEALKNGTIAGAALDVYTHEPEIPLELRVLDNVILSPHMGSSTHENLDAMFQLQAQQLNQYLQNTPLFSS